MAVPYQHDMMATRVLLLWDSPLGVARSASEASYTPKERCHPKVLLDCVEHCRLPKGLRKRFFLNVLTPTQEIRARQKHYCLFPVVLQI